MKKTFIYIYIYTHTYTHTAAAAAKSLQSCPTLCHPVDGSPPGSSVHGIFQARVLDWGAIVFSDIYTHIHTYVCIHIHTHPKWAFLVAPW